MSSNNIKKKKKQLLRITISPLPSKHGSTNYMTYPATLPTLKPPKTNATARERSFGGIDLHEIVILR